MTAIVPAGLSSAGEVTITHALRKMTIGRHELRNTSAALSNERI